MGLKAPLTVGQSVPVTLKFERAGEVTVQVKVEAPAAPAKPADPHAHH
jgi:copper(I)-binding protein